MKKKVKLNVACNSFPLQNSDNYIVVLTEEDKSSQIPIIMHEADAKNIDLIIENFEFKTPLTHALSLQVFKSFDISIKEIKIIDCKESIFESVLECVQKNELSVDKKTIPCRISDAIAFSLLKDIPIYIDRELMDSVSMKISIIALPTKANAENGEENKDPYKKTIKDLSIDQLNKLLKMFIEKEDYLQAAAIRDEIKRRDHL